jgi:hypothetical protein
VGRVNREMVADLVSKDIRQGNGVFPGKNALIEKTEGSQIELWGI